MKSLELFRLVYKSGYNIFAFENWKIAQRCDAVFIVKYLCELIVEWRRPFLKLTGGTAGIRQKVAMSKPKKKVNDNTQTSKKGKQIF